MSIIVIIRSPNLCFLIRSRSLLFYSLKKSPVAIMASGERQSSRKILCVGLVCVDFINVTSGFPEEDSDHDGLRYYWQRGGNASNNCSVLSTIAVPCEFLGVLGSSGPEARFIEEDFKSYGIDTSHCVVEACQCPVSTVILSERSGTRTILHYPRDQPLLSYNSFNGKLQGDFSAYSVVHFELGFNVGDYVRMIEDVVNYNSRSGAEGRVLVSVEVEKPEIQDPEPAMCCADFVFISKDVAMSRGFNDPVSAVKAISPKCHERSVLVCPWGELGATAIFKKEILTAEALADIKAVDSLGAGDTFVAGFIANAIRRGFIENRNSDIIVESLRHGCELAGRKCAMYGYRGLSECKAT